MPGASLLRSPDVHRKLGQGAREHGGDCFRHLRVQFIGRSQWIRLPLLRRRCARQRV